MNKTPVTLEGKRGLVEIVSASGHFFKHFGGGMQIDWSAKNCGFGQAVFSYHPESGKIFVDSEIMSREFITKVMEKMIQDAIFTDFETLEKEIRETSLEEANEIFGFEPHILQLPFHTEDHPEENLIEIRWHLPNEQVLNAWFDLNVLTNNKQDKFDIFEFSIAITQEKSFAKGFVKGEIWKWTIKEKKRKY